MSSPNPALTDLIPVTDRHWRERWATELTRANALERELIQTRAARDAARKTCDDLTDHCESQGRRIAHLDAEIVAFREEIDQLAIEKAGAYDRGIKVGRLMGIDAARCDINQLRDELADVLQHDAVGMDCDSCGGTGKVRDEVDCFSDRIGHYTRDGGEYECGDCFGGLVSR